MANTRSQLLTNKYPTAPTLPTRNTVLEDHGRRRSSVARTTIAAGDAAGHIYRFGEFSAHCTIRDIQVAIADVASAAISDIDFGLRSVSKSSTDPAQISAAADKVIGEAVNLSTITNNTFYSIFGRRPVAAEAAIVGFGTMMSAALQGKPLWHLTCADPTTPLASEEPAAGTNYELVAITTSNPGAGGAFTAIIDYIGGYGD